MQTLGLTGLPEREFKAVDAACESIFIHAFRQNLFQRAAVYFKDLFLVGRLHVSENDHVEGLCDAVHDGELHVLSKSLFKDGAL